MLLRLLTHKYASWRSFAAIKTFVLFRRDCSKSFAKFMVEFNSKHTEENKH